jgi:hypothetical protein
MAMTNFAFLQSFLKVIMCASLSIGGETNVLCTKCGNTNFCICRGWHKWGVVHIAMQNHKNQITSWPHPNFKYGGVGIDGEL